MAQPLAIYASIPPTAGANWLSNPPNLIPVIVTDPYPFWPNLDWSVDGIIPEKYSEVPTYLWSIPIPDPTDGTPKQFTRRLTASGASFNATQIPANSYIRLVLSIAADDQYTVEVLKNGTVIPESPTVGFNFAVPSPLTWRNVKTFSYGEGIGLFLANNDTLDIKTIGVNVPQAAGTPPPNNPAMITWILQIFSPVPAP